MAAIHNTRPATLFAQMERESPELAEAVGHLAETVADYFEGAITRDGAELALVDFRETASLLV